MLHNFLLHGEMCKEKCVTTLGEMRKEKCVTALGEMCKEKYVTALGEMCKEKCVTILSSLILEYMDVNDNDAFESSQPTWEKIVYFDVTRGKLIQLMHTIMVPEQVKTQKIQAEVQVSRQEDTNLIFSNGSTMEDFILFVFVLVRNIDSERFVSKEEGIALAKELGCLFFECSATNLENVHQCCEELALKDLTAVVDEEDVAKFTDAAKEFDSMTKLVR
ncbi:Ran GTPase [Tanacetum coccineum]